VPGATPLALPARKMRVAAVFLAIFFAIFAAIEWSVVANLLGRSVDDVFDLTFLLFQGFWALGWSVGVVLLGALTVLFAFYSESARLESGRLVRRADGQRIVDAIAGAARFVPRVVDARAAEAIPTVETP
jgi:hypothetical protein